MTRLNKPAYQPLTMADVWAAPSSGLTHVSTFSGAGGSCLGFRLAGFRTLWANDIDEHARRCYSQNLSSPIDGRDIRHVTAEDILQATGLQVGQLDVFEGSPPCTAFSTAGKQAHGWNQTKDHAGHLQTNVEDLFYDWLRLLDGLRPRAFIAENVAGLVKGVAKGYFKDILRRMKALGYHSAAQLLDAQWLGVPQARMRVIFIGMREDVQRDPAFPLPLPYRYSVCDALPWITSAEHDTSGIMSNGDISHRPSNTILAGGVGHFYAMHREGGYSEIDVTHRPSRTITNQSKLTVQSGEQPRLSRRKLTIDEVKRLCSFPDDFQMSGSYAHQWARLGNSVPPLMAKAIGCAIRDVLLSTIGRT